MERNITPPSSRSAQWTILILALAVLGFAVGANLFFEHGRVTVREKERLALDARIIQKIVDANLRSLDAVLRDLVDISQGDMPKDINKRLTILGDALSGVHALSICDAKGVVVASNQPGLIGKNFSYREYFKTLRELNDPNILYLSPPFMTVLKTYTMLLERMIPGPDGAFGGIVAATLDTAFFIPLLDSVLYAPDVWINLVHGQGVIFLMRPEREGIAGKNLNQPGTLFYRHMKSANAESVFTETVYATGEERMLAVRTIDAPRLHLTPPLVVGISRDLGEIYAVWRKDLVFHSSLFALTAVLSVIFLRRYQQRQKEVELRLANAAKALKDRERFIRTITDNIPGLVAYWDAGLHSRYANKAYFEWFGRSEEQMLGVTVRELLGPELYEKNEPYITGALSGQPQTFECALTTADGRRRHALVRYIPDLNGNAVRGFYVLVSDVTDLIETRMELEQRVKELDALASTDPLTGIPNRRSFLERLEEEFKRSERYDVPLSFLMIDVDHFKAINDRFGHDAGDAILIMLAESLADALRATDMAGRLGGEEFGAILPQTGLEKAREAAERLREDLSRVCIPSKSGSICFTVSVGVAAFTRETASAHQLMKQADLALYRAKETGRNKTVVYDESMRQET